MKELAHAVEKGLETYRQQTRSFISVSDATTDVMTEVRKLFPEVCQKSVWCMLGANHDGRCM